VKLEPGTVHVARYAQGYRPSYIIVWSEKRDTDCCTVTQELVMGQGWKGGYKWIISSPLH